MSLRKLAAIAAFAAVPAIYFYFLIQELRWTHRVTPAQVQGGLWMLPFAAAAIEWLRRGRDVSVAARILIVLTGILAFGVLLTSSA
jgi:hypothetical protein